MADPNVPVDASIEEQLKQAAAKAGVTYSRSDAEDVAHRDNTPEAMAMALRKYDTRASNTPNQDGGGSSSGGGQASNQAPAQAWNAAPAPAAAPVQDPRAAALYDELVGRAHQSLAISPDDPTIRGQVDAFRAEQTRGTRNYLSDLAEQGGQYQNMRGEQRMAAEKAGQATSGFQAELLGRELQSRRAEIAQALTQRGQMLSGDQQAALSRELAQLDAEIKRQGMAQQNEQFGRSLEQGNSQFGRTLGQGNDQFLRELALRQWQIGDQSAQNWASM